MNRDVSVDTAPPVSVLPITVRPVAGERPETYLRRLAAANHLRPSYLRRFAAGPPDWEGRIQPARLAALSGRPVELLRRTLVGLGRPAPAAAQPRPQRAHPDRSALYAAIRTVSTESRNYMTQRELAATFHVAVTTVSKALHGAVPPTSRKRPQSTVPVQRPFTHVTDALLSAHPNMQAIEIWERIIDTTDIKVSYSTVRRYVSATRTIPARYRRDRDPVA